MMLTGQYSLEYDIVNAGPKKVHVDAYLFQVLAKGTETPLEAEVILLRVLILYEVLILLIDRIVR